MTPTFAAIRLDWLFEVVREGHVFLSHVTAEHRAEIPLLTQRFLAKLSDPRTAGETMVFRCLLLQLALQVSTTLHPRTTGNEHGSFERMLAVLRRWGDRSREAKAVFLECVRSTTSAGSDPSDAPVLEAARDLLERNYAQSLTIRSLACELGCQPRWLARAFRKRFAASIPDYLGSVRVSEGLKLINGTEVKVEAIALAVGYRSKKNFYRAVRRVTGLTPSQLRGAQMVFL